MKQKGWLTVLTEAVQVKIKQLIVDGVLRSESKSDTFAAIGGVIKKYAKQVPPELREEFVGVLIHGTEKLYNKFAESTAALSEEQGLSVLFMGAILRKERKALETVERSGTPIDEQIIAVYDNERENALASRQNVEYTELIFPDKIPIKDIEEKLRAKITELAETETESGDGHNLRNRAEMYIRHEAQQDSIEQMRQNGVELVWASTHADCSKRCYPWQGRLYSLNGTSGKINGVTYVPLEQATDIYYTTKAGVRYKNGLLGFNCRHRLIPYKEEHEPPQSYDLATTRARRALNEEQRAKERAIRAVKRSAWVMIDQDGEEAELLFRKAKAMTKSYRSFCASNNLVALPYRLEVMQEEFI